MIHTIACQSFGRASFETTGDVGERVAVGVADDEAGLGLLDGLGRREAALSCHSARLRDRSATHSIAARIIGKEPAKITPRAKTTDWVIELESVCPCRSNLLRPHASPPAPPGS